MSSLVFHNKWKTMLKTVLSPIWSYWIQVFFVWLEISLLWSPIYDWLFENISLKTHWHFIGYFLTSCKHEYLNIFEWKINIIKSQGLNLVIKLEIFLKIELKKTLDLFSQYFQRKDRELVMHISIKQDEKGLSQNDWNKTRLIWDKHSLQMHTHYSLLVIYFLYQLLKANAFEI